MALTQHRPHSALAGRRFGAFTGKTASDEPAPGPHPVSKIIQARPHGALAGVRFGSFSGKTSTDALPGAPTGVVGTATGGTTATLALTDTTGGSASHRWQLRAVSGTWADATGATNPSAPGTVSFAATGLTPATEYEIQARSESGSGNSAYTAGSNFWTDNSGGGDSELPPPDTTAPVLTGEISVTNNTTGTSYTLTVDAGSDDVAVTGYELSLNGGAYSDFGSSPTTNVTGRTAGTTDVVLIRCYDAWGNRSNALSVSVDLPLTGPLSDAEMRELHTWLRELHMIHGLRSGSPMTVTQSTRTAGSIVQHFTGNDSSTTVTRA